LTLTEGGNRKLPAVVVFFKMKDRKEERLPCGKQAMPYWHYILMRKGKALWTKMAIAIDQSHKIATK
jgi:hypothetical protein